MAIQAVQARSLYRRFLRELPARTPSILANPSPIQQHIRTDFASATPNSPASPDSTDGAQERLSSSFRCPSETASTAPPSLQHQLKKPAEERLAQAEQYLHYLKAQREYITLIERYNPGMNMGEEDRVRLSARRVGMNLPVEVQRDDGKK